MSGPSTDVKNVIENRLKSPFFGTMIFYFFVVNWKVLIILTGISGDFKDRINEIIKLDIGFCSYLGWPLLWTVLSLVIAPYIAGVVDNYNNYVNIQSENYKSVVSDKHDNKAEARFDKAAAVVGLQRRKLNQIMADIQKFKDEKYIHNGDYGGLIGGYEKLLDKNLKSISDINSELTAVVNKDSDAISLQYQKLNT